MSLNDANDATEKLKQQLQSEKDDTAKMGIELKEVRCSKEKTLHRQCWHSRFSSKNQNMQHCCRFVGWLHPIEKKKWCGCGRNV